MLIIKGIYCHRYGDQKEFVYKKNVYILSHIKMFFCHVKWMIA